MRLPAERSLISGWLLPCAIAGLILGGAVRILAGAEIIDRVLAVVSGDLIMLSDLNAARDLHLIAVDPAADPIAALLPRLIDRALILAEVERYAPPEPPSDAVDRRLQSVRATFPSEEAFAAALARVGFDQPRLRERLRQDLRILAYLDQRFTVQPPSDEELGRYYREHPAMFADGARQIPFEQARPRVAEAAIADRRQALVDDWVAGLRRRAEIIEPSPASAR
jgi:hypothetical protein